MTKKISQNKHYKSSYVMFLPLVILGVAFSGIWLSSSSNAASETFTVSPVVAGWNMDENPIDPSAAVQDMLGYSNGTTPANWNGSSVAPLHPASTGAFYFPGWTALTGSTTVDPTASSYSIPHDNMFNPEKNDFSISMWVVPLDPTKLVQSGAVKSTDTFNIVQKGLAGPKAQQWKVSLNTKGRYLCTFRGPDSASRVINYSAKSTAYTYGVVRHVICGIRAGVITLQVSTNGVIKTFTAQGPVGGVTNTSDVTVGKKPGSSVAGDSFAGTIDELVISKGQ